MGKNNLDRLYLIFSQLRIPVYVIWDGDSQKRSGDKANRILQWLLDAEQCADFPVTQVQDRFAVFEDKLETELRAIVGSDAYDAAASTFALEYGYADQSACNKSPLFFSDILTDAAQRVELGVFFEMAQKLRQFVHAIETTPQSEGGEPRQT